MTSKHDTPTPAEDPAPGEDTVPTEIEELQARCDILSATVKILCEGVEHFRTQAAAADELQAEVRRLNTLISTGTIGPKDRNDSRNALR